MAELYPVPPPTTNNLDPFQRKQLLKSTQKLGALLGTTPRVLEAGAILPPPLTPGTKAFRREGKVFYAQSASSSRTSLDSCETESYIWIPSPEDVLTRHHKSVSSPISIEFPHVKPETPAKAVPRKPKASHQRTKTAPQQLSQPLLYRLRSRPTPPRNLIPSIYDDKALPPSPLSPITRFAQSKELSDSDRRRKMAKLTRTLGETIPPELVFGNPPPRTTSLSPKSATTATLVAQSSSSVAQVSPSRRKRSVTGAHRPTESLSRSNSSLDAPLVPPLPPKDTTVLEGASASLVNSGANQSSLSSSSSPSAEASIATPRFPPQTPVVTVTTTTSNATGATIPTTIRRTRERPRSLTITHIPADLMSATAEQGVAGSRSRSDSLLPPSPIGTRGRQPSRSLDEPERSRETLVSTSTVNNVEYGYRKENDWSGEWNVKDMGDVMSALRGLRLR